MLSDVAGRFYKRFIESVVRSVDPPDGPSFGLSDAGWSVRSSVRPSVPPFTRWFLRPSVIRMDLSSVSRPSFRRFENDEAGKEVDGNCDDGDDYDDEDEDERQRQRQ